MDLTRAVSPPTTSSQHINLPHRSTTKVLDMLPSRTRAPMTIPNIRGQPPPPPLPPPTHLNDIAAGSDPGWEWENRRHADRFGEGRDSNGSDLSMPQGWKIKQERDDAFERPAYPRRGSSQATIKPAPEVHPKYDFSRNHDEGYYSLSGASSANYQFHGVTGLERQNLEQSSNAYDHKLLSRFGKSGTPPRALGAGGDAAPAANLPSYQPGKHPHPLRSVSLSDGSSKGPSNLVFRKQSFSSRMGGSPQSRPVSPGMNSSASSPQQYQGFRSPTRDESTPSSATESEAQSRRFSPLHGLRQQRSRRSGSGPGIFSGRDDSAELAGHAKPKSMNSTASEGARWYRQGSQDQPITFPEPDSASVCDLPMEETVNTASALRQLHLEDRSPLSRLDSVTSSYYYSSKPVLDSRLGMKRRASSPPPEAAHEDKAPSLLVGDSTELYRNATSSLHLSANPSPQNRFAPPIGSISSVSSTGLRNGSYTSSNGLSVGSSLTSISSHDRPSPGGISPSSDQQHNGRDSPYVTAISMNSSPQISLARPIQQTIPDIKPEAAAARKFLGDSAAPRKHPNAPNIHAHAHICECCPKKPKKFGTLEELKNHESEKQYQCQFCHNRFKNKNEAERHQNSLHLRRHSWSCATLAGRFDAAFHGQPPNPPSNNPNHTSPPMNFTPPDVCGYCGEEFPNEPAPDWDARMAHLTNVHKFGECNQSKKFFRADHFRQHLKHSHAGTSGKWTNMLENACMKEEPPLTGPGPGPEMMQPPGAPVAHMGGMMGIGSGRGLPMNIMAGMRDNRIEEMREEV